MHCHFIRFPIRIWVLGLRHGDDLIIGPDHAGQEVPDRRNVGTEEEARNIVSGFRRDGESRQDLRVEDLLEERRGVWKAEPYISEKVSQ